MKKYRSKWSFYAFDIEEIEVGRETPRFVVFKTGIRETKRSNDWWNYFDLFGEAKQYLIEEDKIPKDHELTRLLGADIRTIEGKNFLRIMLDDERCIDFHLKFEEV